MISRIDLPHSPSSREASSNPSDFDSLPFFETFANLFERIANGSPEAISLAKPHAEKPALIFTSQHSDSFLLTSNKPGTPSLMGTVPSFSVDIPDEKNMQTPSPALDGLIGNDHVSPMPIFSDITRSSDVRNEVRPFAISSSDALQQASPHLNLVERDKSPVILDSPSSHAESSASLFERSSFESSRRLSLESEQGGTPKSSDLSSFVKEHGLLTAKGVGSSLSVVAETPSGLVRISSSISASEDGKGRVLSVLLESSSPLSASDFSEVSRRIASAAEIETEVSFLRRDFGEGRQRQPHSFFSKRRFEETFPSDSLSHTDFFRTSHGVVDQWI